jgi:hypothetical protein
MLGESRFLLRPQHSAVGLIKQNALISNKGFIHRPAIQKGMA